MHCNDSSLLSQVIGSQSLVNELCFSGRQIDQKFEFFKLFLNSAISFTHTDYLPQEDVGRRGGEVWSRLFSLWIKGCQFIKRNGVEEYCKYLGSLFSFNSYRQKIKRNGKRQLNIFGWVHLSSLRIKVTLVFSIVFSIVFSSSVVIFFSLKNNIFEWTIINSNKCKEGLLSLPRLRRWQYSCFCPDCFGRVDQCLQRRERILRLSLAVILTTI